MNLLQLKYFQTVAQLEHISKAAKQLNIAQPSLSMTISKLEQELGVSLFDRQGRNIVLNPYGQMLLRHANRILHQLSLLQTDLTYTQQQIENGFNLTVDNSAYLYGWMDHFLKMHPQAKVSQNMLSEEQAVQALLDERTDIGVFQTSCSYPEIEQVMLLQDEYIPLFSILHPLVQKEKLCFADIKDEAIVSLPATNNFIRIVDRIFMQQNCIPNIIFEGNIKIANKLVSMGKGLIFSSRQMIYASSFFAAPSTETIPPMIAMPISDMDNRTTLSLCWKKKRNLPPMAQIFCDETISSYPRYTENETYCQDSFLVTQ